MTGLKSMSPREIREYCISNNLNLFDFLSREEKTKERGTKPKKKNKSVKPIKRSRTNPEDVVLFTLDDIRKVFSTEQFTFRDFVDYAESDLNQAKVWFRENCPLSGFAADVLYKYAESAKFGKGREDRRRITNPVREDELSGLLGVSFGTDASQIAGILPSEYVKEHYQLDEEGQLANADGAYNIEGTKNWDREGKKEVRARISDLAAEKILKKLSEKRAVEIQKLESERAEKADEACETSRKRTLPRQIEISTKDKGAVLTVKRRLGGFLEKTLDVIGKNKIQYNVQGNNITFTVNPVYMDKFETAWQNFLRHEGQGIKQSVKRTEIASRRTKTSGKLEQRLSEIDIQLDFLGRNRPTIAYLGLEGPNFGSFLNLAGIAEQFGVDMRAIIPEYNYRNFSLMKSIASAGISKTFEQTQIVYGTIDDLILLDFVQDPGISLETNGGYYVKYSGGKIELERYHALLDEIDASGKTIAHLAEKYGVPEKFVKIVSERNREKFDVVFLDYVCGITEKRNKALETLIKRRTKNHSIVATTSNKNPKINHDVMAEGIPEFHLEYMLELSDRQAYNIEEFDDQTYGTNGNEMYFCIYCIKREKTEQN